MNPYIELKGSPFYVVQESVEWKAPRDGEGRELPRRAGVEFVRVRRCERACGAGGIRGPVEGSGAWGWSGPVAVVLSARTVAQLKQQAQGLVDFIAASSSPVDLGSLAFARDEHAQAEEIIDFSIFSESRDGQSIHCRERSCSCRRLRLRVLMSRISKVR